MNRCRSCRCECRAGWVRSRGCGGCGQGRDDSDGHQGFGERWREGADIVSHGIKQGRTQQLTSERAVPPEGPA